MSPFRRFVRFVARLLARAHSVVSAVPTAPREELARAFRRQRNGERFVRAWELCESVAAVSVFFDIPTDRTIRIAGRLRREGVCLRALPFYADSPRRYSTEPSPN